jgi:mono/diheme cytochrome c family protein
MKMKTGIALAVVMAATTMTSAFAQSGADNYKAKCAMCHMADGSASGPVGKSMKIAAFNSPEASKLSEADIITVIKNGKGKMTGYAGKLTDAQIKEVAAFVKTLQK